MVRRRDQTFHLMMATFFLILTAVSSLTTLYETNTGGFRAWLDQRIRLDASTAGLPLWSALDRLSRFRSELPRHRLNALGTGAQPRTAPFGAGHYAAIANTGGLLGKWTSLLSAPGAAATNSVSLQAGGMRLEISGVSNKSGVNQVRTLLSQNHLADLVSHNLRMQAVQPVHIYVAQTAEGYARALQTIGISKSQAQSLSQDTGGFTQGNTVIIALYQNQRTADLANTLAHELTHILINQNVGHLPSWINEGLAVFNGMAGQSAVQGPVAYAGYARQIAESVLDAAADGDIAPLADDESKVLSGNRSYDLELQDWLAVTYLMRTHGYSAFTDYFRRIRFGVPNSAAFYASFGETPQQFNREFTGWLKSAVNSKDKGFSLQLSVAPSFRGTMQILQHNAHVWRAFTLQPGERQVSVAPDGSVSGVANGGMHLIRDNNPPDDSTVQLVLKPAGPLTYHGRRVKECGFDVDYHYGMYAFANTWVTLENGQQLYLDAPALFGVSLLRLSELPGANPVTALVMMRSSG
ncbi:MAG: hypothetical protein IRZ33_07055 [Alicyclobacillaceae bacterium]|nr:hypothetical protein [Alicyclobacillaceae bacterium]